MKKFLILGKNDAFIYKNVWVLLCHQKIFPGYIFNKGLEFMQQDGYYKKSAVSWYSSIPIDRNAHLELTKTYNPVDYPKYDNYDAVEVSRTKDIPVDYSVLMGVPITFIDKYNPEQFEIIGFWNDYSNGDYAIVGTPCIIDSQHQKWKGPVVNGKAKYFRIIIKNKHPVVSD